VDTLSFKPQFVITENSQQQLGFETFLNVREIEEGKHILKVIRKDIRRDSVYHRTIIQIPFWYYKE
ncbi:MAG: hypothetical protein KJO90_08690, partial [Eudoraea sp.]|nr:hypothetical protein [Eudoraea sp.]